MENLAVAWDHLAAAAHYLARAARSSPLAVGAPPRCAPLLPSLQGLCQRPYNYGGDLELGFNGAGFGDNAGFDDGAGFDDNAASTTAQASTSAWSSCEAATDAFANTMTSSTTPPMRTTTTTTVAAAVLARASAAVTAASVWTRKGDDDDFEFGITDIFDLTYVVGICIPPYPIYQSTSSYRDLHADFWTWLAFFYSLLFTVLLTISSVRVFRSSRRFIPTALRALVLALSISAQVMAAVHFLPSSTLSMGVAYAGISLQFSTASSTYWSGVRAAAPATVTWFAVLRVAVGCRRFATKG